MKSWRGKDSGSPVRMKSVLDLPSYRKKSEERITSEADRDCNIVQWNLHSILDLFNQVCPLFRGSTV